MGCSQCLIQVEQIFLLTSKKPNVRYSTLELHIGTQILSQPISPALSGQISEVDPVILVWSPTSEPLQIQYNTIMDHPQNTGPYCRPFKQAKGPYEGPASNPLDDSLSWFIFLGPPSFSPSSLRVSASLASSGGMASMATRRSRAKAQSVFLNFRYSCQGILITVDLGLL